MKGGSCRTAVVAISVAIILSGICLSLQYKTQGVPTYATPSIKGLNPDAQVRLPQDPNGSHEQGQPANPAARRETAANLNTQPWDLDHLALFMEEEIQTAAQSLIRLIGEIISDSLSSVQHSSS